MRIGLEEVGLVKRGLQKLKLKGKKRVIKKYRKFPFRTGAE